MPTGTEAGSGPADEVLEKRDPDAATEKPSKTPDKSKDPGRKDSDPAEPLGDDPDKPTSTKPPEPSADRAPEGYQTVTDPTGFKMTTPTGFVRTDESPRVFYNSADNAFRIGVHPQALDPNGPAAVMRRAHASGPSDYPGYRDGSVRETTHNGFPAAVWEFTWDGGAGDGGPRRTYDLSWDEGGKMYDLWVSAPAGQAAAAERHFIEAHRSFVRTGS